MAINIHDYDIITKAKKGKTVEDAVMLVKKYNATPEAAAQDTGAPLDKVQEALAV